MRLRVNIIGAGKLGQTLGYLFSQSGLATIVGIHNTNIKSAERALQFIGQGQCYTSIQALPEADVYLVTTPDDVILEKCLELCAKASLQVGNILVHCSGTLTSDTLAAAKTKHCYVASVHPASTFAHPPYAVQHFSGTLCTMEGDSSALEVLVPLFTQLGGIILKINKKNKMLYHMGSVFSSNYLVTLASQANALFLESGMDEATAFKLVLSFMQQTLTNLSQLNSFNLALTGPIQRGDLATIRAHLQTLTNHPLQAMYTLLGEKTLNIVDHDMKIKAKLNALFKNEQKEEASAP